MSKSPISYPKGGAKISIQDGRLRIPDLSGLGPLINANATHYQSHSVFCYIYALHSTNLTTKIKRQTIYEQMPNRDCDRHRRVLRHTAAPGIVRGKSVFGQEGGLDQTVIGSLHGTIGDPGKPCHRQGRRPIGTTVTSSPSRRVSC